MFMQNADRKTAAVSRTPAYALPFRKMLTNTRIFFCSVSVRILRDATKIFTASTRGNEKFIEINEPTQNNVAH